MIDEYKLVDCFDILCLERWLANYESVQDNSNRPRVNLEAVSVILVEEYFRSDVVWCPADGLLTFTRALNQGCQPKVSHFDVHVGIEEEVAKFQVTVNDLVCVHVVTCAKKLNHEETSFWFCEAASAAEHVHKGTIVAELKGHVNVRIVLETVEEANDVRMTQSPMNLDLSIELHCL
jgi:hypothetical protein